MKSKKCNRCNAEYLPTSNNQKYCSFKCWYDKYSPMKLIQPIDYIKNEEWKDIEGYTGVYMVSNKGRIKSLDRTIITSNNKHLRVSGILIKKNVDKCGYERIGFRNKNHSINYNLVHRVVAFAFIPNPENKPQVNHKNGTKTDNRIENLEWCTASENIRHAFKNGLKVAVSGDVHYMKKLKGYKSHSTKEVVCTKTGKRWVSARVTSKELSIQYSTLINMLNGAKRNNTTLKYS